METLNRFFRPLMLTMLFASACWLGMGTTAVLAAETPELPENGAIAEVNDIEMYYEVHGEGEPLLLIHSVAADMHQFDAILPQLAEEYQVIAVDFRGHGRTTDSGQPLRYELLASDMLALMDTLGIESANIIGNKDGGIIGLQMAMTDPKRVNRLVAASANFSPDGFQPWFLEYLKGFTLEAWEAMAGDMYRELSPTPEIMPVMLQKDRIMLLTEPNFTIDGLSTITSPVLVLAGADEDVLKIGHVQQTAAAIPDAELVLIEGGSHGVLDEEPQRWIDAVSDFLAGELDAPPVGKYAPVNDIAMYYEIHGEGEPLLLMPSGMWSTDDFAALTEILAEKYQVIVMDPRGRGRSTDSGERLNFSIMADDVVALMDELSIEQSHVVGWADSAIVGLEMAMRYPERVDKLVAYAPNYTVEGLTEEHRDWLKSLSLDDMRGMFEEAYSAIAPDPDYLPVALERIRALYLTEPNYTIEQLSEIEAPTLVLDGEEDEFIVEGHLAEMAEAMPHADLAFLPGLSHYAPYEDPAAWTDAVLAFLSDSDSEMAEQPVPRLEPTECKYDVLEGASAECAYLVVPEDRTDPDSPTIRVQVVKFLSASETPASDPIIVIPGGPGAPGPFYSWLVAALPFGETLRAERDIYVLETRGAMYSEPAFYCPEAEADVADFLGKTMAEDTAWTEEAYRACHDRLVEEGANFSAYGILDIAEDVVDLRTALGVDEINVYGVSYGTPPAMLLMREQPEGIRSVILDSIVPPDVIVAEEMLTNTQSSLDATFAACAADPDCDAAYLDLETVFSEVLAQLREEPVTVTVTDEAGKEHTVSVDDVKFVHFVTDSVFIGDGFTSLPAAIYAALDGDLQAAAEGWMWYVTGEHGPATAEAGAFARGLTYATICLQDGSVTDLETVAAKYEAIADNPSLLDWAMLYHTIELISPCEYWQVTPRDPNIAVEPVESDLPVLMLTGTFDPNTPPAQSQPAAERLSNSFFYELPAGHGLLFMDCAVDLMAQFLAGPTQEPDAACIDEMTPAWVLPE